MSDHREGVSVVGLDYLCLPMRLAREAGYDDIRVDMDSTTSDALNEGY